MPHKAFAATRSAAAYVVEAMEQRYLLASLLDLVGKTSFPTPPSPGSVLEQNVVLRPVDSQQDILWLANHVDRTTLLAMEKTSGELQAMYAQWLRDGKSLSDISIHNTLPADVYLTKGETLMTHLATTDADALANRLAQLGFEVAGKFNGTSDRIVDVYTPVSRIAEIASLPGVLSAVAQIKPLTRVGSAQSEWPGIANIPQLNLDLPGSDGTNIDYGVISNSMNRKGLGVAGSQATLDLPPGNRVTVVQDGPAGASDEGRGMSELIYDAAPDSDILFYGPSSPADFATGVTSLANSGADVIVDDLAYLNVPIFQDGAMAQAIDSVVTNQKVLYFSAGGNENGKTYYGFFNEGTTTNNYHAFDSAGDEVLDFTLTAGSTVNVGLHWGEKNGGATKDFDLRIQNSSGTVVASDTSNQIGGNPYAQVSYTNTGSSTVTLGITVFYSIGAGSAVGMPLFVDGSFSKGVSYTDNDWGGPSVRQQVNAAKAFAVGAVPASNPSSIESFSSLGGVKVVYDSAGNLINEIRPRPDFVAADGVTTSFFPSASPGNVFFGTSAAAPDAAAIGGLMQEAAGGPRSLTYDQARDMLKNSAFDLGATGFDTTYGAGRVDGLASVVAAKQNSSNNSTYIELNQNGFGSASGSMTTNSTIPSIYFSTSGTGTTAIQTISGSIFSYGSVFEYGDVGSQNLLETKRVDSQIGVYSGWTLVQSTRHSVSAFARQDVSTVPGGTADDITFIVAAPVATKTTIPIDANGIGAVNSTIGSNYEVDYYQFTTPSTFDTANGVNIGASFTGMDGVLSVFDGSGNQLYRADASGFNSTETIAASTFAANTTYYLRVGSYSGNSHGSYHLGIRAAKSLAGGMGNIGPTFGTLSVLVPDGGTATSPNTAVGQFYNISGVNSIAGYAFGADNELGGTFTIDVTSTQMDTVIAVYAYNGIYGTNVGEMVAFSDDVVSGNHNSRVTFTAQPGVKHILAVKSYDNTVGNGTYTINASYGGSPNSTSITLNSTGDASVSVGSIPAGGEARTYSFVAPATSASATISLTNQVGNGDIYLFDNAGHLIGGDSNGGTGVETINVASLTPGATYHITVIPELYAAALTSATLNIDVATVNTPAAPDLSQVSDLGLLNTDNITSQNTEVVFLVSGTVGTFMRLFRDGVQIDGPAAAISPGFIALRDYAPTEGVHNYTATAAVTASSPQSAASPALAVTYDFTPPVQNSFSFIRDANTDHLMFVDFNSPIYDFFAYEPIVKNLTNNTTLPGSSFRIDNFAGGANNFYYDTTAANDQLPDGNYEVTIPAGAAMDLAGNVNAQTKWSFFFQNGDANSDRKVDTQDFNILAGNFGQAGKTFSSGNFDYDSTGTVDSLDFNIFVSKYGMKLLPPAGALLQAGPSLFSDGNRPSRTEDPIV